MDPTDVQCRIYLLFAMRPLQAWTVISQASKECMLLANTDRKLKGEEFIDLLERAYWTSYVIEK
jgi:hypothetical protein